VGVQPANALSTNLQRALELRGGGSKNFTAQYAEYQPVAFSRPQNPAHGFHFAFRPATPIFAPIYFFFCFLRHPR